jgi:ABC-2 type transport system ATP-binding protein
METSGLAIKAEHLKKSFKGAEVLRDVSFGVEEGTIFALLGANGSGKTTTINILNDETGSQQGMTSRVM